MARAHGAGHRVERRASRERNDRLRDIVARIGFEAFTEIIDRFLIGRRPHQHSVAPGFADRRELYNDQVNLNNIRVKVFPDVMIAQKFGFAPAQLLEFSASEKADVDLGALFST